MSLVRETHSQVYTYNTQRHAKGKETNFKVKKIQNMKVKQPLSQLERKIQQQQQQQQKTQVFFNHHIQLTLHMYTDINK